MYIQSESESSSGSTRQEGEGGPNHLCQSSSARTARDPGWEAVSVSVSAWDPDDGVSVDFLD